MSQYHMWNNLVSGKNNYGIAKVLFILLFIWRGLEIVIMREILTI